MPTSEGTLRYTGSNDQYRLVVDVDPGLADFYRSRIPPSIKFQKPRYEPHITVVRAGMEQPVIMDAWGRYEGRVITFEYSPYVHMNKTYLWLNVWCDELKEVRKELGMIPLSEWCLPPGGSPQCFHTTLGNKKNMLA